MSTDIKLSKSQLYKTVESGGSFDSYLVNLRKKALASNAIPLARNNLPGFVSNLTSNAIKNLKKKK